LLLVVFVVASALEAATTMCIMAQPVWMHGCVCKIPRHCVATLSMATPSVTAAFYSRTTSKCWYHFPFLCILSGNGHSCTGWCNSLQWE
jgi:hypothetical protein